MIHLGCEIIKQKRVWMAVHKGSGHATDDQTDLSRAAHDDVMVTHVKRRGEKMTRIINVYDQTDVQTAERQVSKRNWPRAIGQRGSIMIVGDMNVHSRRWDPSYREQCNGMFREEIIDGNELDIGNDDDRPTHHWARNGQEGKSTIDVTLATRPSMRWTILDKIHSTASDYQVIDCKFKVNTQKEADHV